MEKELTALFLCNILTIFELYDKNIEIRSIKMETKKDKFRRLAELRTSNIIETLASLAKLANKKNYDYSDQEVKQIFYAIEEELKLTKQAFKASGSNKTFKLK